MSECENPGGHLWFPLEQIVASNGVVVWGRSMCGYCDAVREWGEKA